MEQICAKLLADEQAYVADLFKLQEAIQPAVKSGEITGVAANEFSAALDDLVGSQDQFLSELSRLATQHSNGPIDAAAYGKLVEENEEALRIYTDYCEYLPAFSALVEKEAVSGIPHASVRAELQRPRARLSEYVEFFEKAQSAVPTATLAAPLAVLKQAVERAAQAQEDGQSLLDYPLERIADWKGTDPETLGPLYRSAVLGVDSEGTHGLHYLHVHLYENMFMYCQNSAKAGGLVLKKTLPVENIVAVVDQGDLSLWVSGYGRHNLSHFTLHFQSRRQLERWHGSFKSLMRRPTVAEALSSVEDWKGYSPTGWGDVLAEDSLMVVKNGAAKRYHVILFQSILVCLRGSVLKGRIVSNSLAEVELKTEGSSTHFVAIDWMDEGGDIYSFSLHCLTGESAELWRSALQEIIDRKNAQQTTNPAPRPESASERPMSFIMVEHPDVIKKRRHGMIR